MKEIQPCFEFEDDTGRYILCPSPTFVYDKRRMNHLVVYNN